MTIIQYLNQQLTQNPQFSSFRAVVGRYCLYLNSKPNKKIKPISPVQFNMDLNLV